MEIEKKYLVQTLPADLEQYPHAAMEQTYISIDPVIRIRKSNQQYTLTVKGKGHLAREEFELDLTEEQYLRLKSKRETALIKKERYFIPICNGAYRAELDIYQEHFAPLMTVEVEFPSISSANQFTPPSWFGKDVTEEAAYKNANMAKYGISNFKTE